MAVTVRTLLARVKPFRPDLDDEIAMFGLRNALAQIATRAFVLTKTDPLAVVPKATYSTDCKNTGNIRTVRVESVYGLSTYSIRTQNGIQNEMVYDGNWNPTTQAPWMSVPDPVANVGHFYITNATGTWQDTAHGGPSNTFIIGDILFSNGTYWTKYIPYPSESTSNSIDGFQLIDQTNKPSYEWERANPQSGRSFLPLGWYQQDGMVNWIMPPKEPLIIRVTRCIDYATAVDLDMDSIDVPSDVESVMVNGALAYIYGLPGDGQDKQMALRKDAEFKSGLGDLKAMSIFGQGGSPIMQHPCFAGRRTF
jgi:hypothetical protein